MGQVERRLTLALGLPAGASLSRVCAAVEAKVAAVEASNARNLDTIESVGRLERERDEARAELAKVAALLDAEGAGADGEPEPVSTTLRYWLEACKQTEIELRYRDAARPAVDLEDVDAALGYDEHDTRHDGDRVERIEELQERLLVAEQDRDRATAKLVETQSDLASARAESAHLALDLGPGLLDPRSERAIGIALDGLIALGVGPAGVALVGVVRALCGIGVRG